MDLSINNGQRPVTPSTMDLEWMELEISDGEAEVALLEYQDGEPILLPAFTSTRHTRARSPIPGPLYISGTVTPTDTDSLYSALAFKRLKAANMSATNGGGQKM